MCRREKVCRPAGHWGPWDAHIPGASQEDLWLAPPVALSTSVCPSALRHPTLVAARLALRTALRLSVWLSAHLGGCAHQGGGQVLPQLCHALLIRLNRAPDGLCDPAPGGLPRPQ